MKAAVIAVANHNQGWLMPQLIKSCERHKTPIIFLGHGFPYKRHSQRFGIVLDYLERTKDDITHYIYIDAFDTVLAAGADEIMEAWATYNSPIVQAGERFCWPVKEWESRYPKCESPFRFINGGGWIAQKDMAIHMMRMGKRVDAGVHLDPKGGDQELLSKMFLEKIIPSVIDTQCRIYQTMCESHKWVEWDSAKGKIRNNATGEYPKIFHFNAHANPEQVLKWLNL